MPVTIVPGPGGRSCRATVATDSSAMRWSSAVVRFWTGCSTNTAAPSKPRARHCAAKASRNSEVKTLTPGMPRPSRSRRSCVLHDVHDPQSDNASTTAWHSVAIRWSSSGGAVLVFVGLR